MNPQINDTVRAASSKAILTLFPVAVRPMDLRRSAVFALQAAGAADDVFTLGPYSGPCRITAIAFVSALDAASTRTFTLHITSSSGTDPIVPNDVNVLDPQSPSSLIMPARTNVILPLGRPSPFNPFWLKLSRFKGGSISFEMTCWVYIAQGR